jgi:hypothetical protein
MRNTCNVPNDLSKTYDSWHFKIESECSSEIMQLEIMHNFEVWNQNQVGLQEKWEKKNACNAWHFQIESWN